MKRSFIPVFILVLSLFQISSMLFAQDSNTSISIDQAKEKIKQMNDKWSSYMKSGNINGVLDFYAEDAVILPPNSKMARGKDAIKKHMEDEMKQLDKYSSVDFKTVDVVGGNGLFVETGTYKISMQMKGSGKPMEDQGKYVTAWKVQPDGSLKVIIDTNNSDMSMKEMQNAMKENNKDDNEMTGGKEKK